MSESFICKAHLRQQPLDTSLDCWVKVGNDRVCSWCGSWHPDELIKFLPDAANPDLAGHQLTTSTKSYKLYVKRPCVTNAKEGAIKFYTWHVPVQVSEETQKIYREAIEVSFRKMMAQVDRTFLALGLDIQQ